MILLGLVALPQMLRLGYDSKLAIGVVCAGGSLGTMIPPSLVLVFYGLTTSTSIGDLFIASTMPGVMLALLYMGYVLVRCLINPRMGPPVYDLIWFGVLFNITIQVGYLSPPFGQAAFYLKSVTPPEISLNHIFNSLWPFIGLQVVGPALLLFIPDIALGLGKLLK